MLVRRLTLSVNHLIDEKDARTRSNPVLFDLFSDYDELRRQQEEAEAELVRERRRQEAIIKIKKLFGKNAILKGLSFADGATQRDRNSQIGGHHK